MNVLTSKISLVVYALAIFFASLATSGVLRVAQGGSRVARNPEVRRKIRAPAATEADAVRIEDYAAIDAQRFCALPTPQQPQYVPTASPQTPQLIREEPAGYILRGTIIHSIPSLSRAFIEIPGVEGQRAYRPGEEVHGATVLAITNEEVELRRGEESIFINLSYRSTAPQSFGNSSAPRSSTDQDRPSGDWRDLSNRRSYDRREEPRRRQEERRRREAERTPEETYRRLPSSLRQVLDELDSQRRLEILQMDSAERMRVFRELLKERKTRQKEERRRQPGAPRRWRGADR